MADGERSAVLDMLERLANAVPKIASDLAVMRGDVERVVRDVERNSRALHGNGQVKGLRREHDALERRLTDLCRKVERELQKPKRAGAAGEAEKWYARGQFWLWAAAVVGVVGHVVTLASTLLEMLR